MYDIYSRGMRVQVIYVVVDYRQNRIIKSNIYSERDDHLNLALNSIILFALWYVIEILHVRTERLPIELLLDKRTALTERSIPVSIMFLE